MVDREPSLTEEQRREYLTSSKDALILVIERLYALLDEKPVSPSLSRKLAIQECVQVVVGYEGKLSWPNHPNSKDMHTASIDTLIAVEDALLELLEKPVDHAPSERLWRVGSKIPSNVYEGDRPVCMCKTDEDAKQIVNALNAEIERSRSKTT